MFGNNITCRGNIIIVHSQACSQEKPFHNFVRMLRSTLLYMLKSLAAIET